MRERDYHTDPFDFLFPLFSVFLVFGFRVSNSVSDFFFFLREGAAKLYPYGCTRQSVHAGYPIVRPNPYPNFNGVNYGLSILTIKTRSIIHCYVRRVSNFLQDLQSLNDCNIKLICIIDKFGPFN